MGWKNWTYWLKGAILGAGIWTLNTIYNLFASRKWLFSMDMNYILNWLHIGGLIFSIFVFSIIGLLITMSVKILNKELSYWSRTLLIGLIWNIFMSIYLTIQFSFFICSFSGGCDYRRLVEGRFIELGDFIVAFGITLIPVIILSAIIVWIIKKVKSKTQK